MSHISIGAPVIEQDRTLNGSDRVQVNLTCSATSCLSSGGGFGGQFRCALCYISVETRFLAVCARCCGTTTAGFVAWKRAVGAG